MKFIKQIDPRIYLILLLSVLVVVGFSTFRNSSRVRASRQIDRTSRQIDTSSSVMSFVPNLIVVDAQIRNRAVSLTLRNDYNKTITAFAVSSSRIITRSELIDTDEVLAPGATVTKDYELPSSPSPEYATTLEAVVFDDGTAVGKAKNIKQILDARAGQRAQIARILPALQKALDDARTGDLRQQWPRIKSSISELPDQEVGESFEFNAALQDAKHFALIRIGEVEQIEHERGEDIARQRLAHIKERYEIKSAKPHGPLKGSQ